MTGLRSCAVVGALAGGLAALLAGDAATVGLTLPGAGNEAGPPWTETKWPFLLDQWGTGRAFRCPAAHCGAEVYLYVRAKRGFCNCTTGVADDEELDRVGDVDLLAPRFAPRAGGQPVTVGWMSGRSRPYQVDNASGPHSALAIAFNDKCDVIVATVTTDRDTARNAERAALDFLNGEAVMRWTKAELGL
jgi:hypothetical protein